MTLIDRGWREIERKLRELDTKKIDVGLHGNAGSDIVERAFFNEYGTEDIPERSFLRSTLNENTAQLQTKSEKAVQQIVNGGAVEGELGKVGLYFETLTKKKVTSNSFAANHPSTVKQKGSSKPLIDTGQMLNSIRYELKNE